MSQPVDLRLLPGNLKLVVEIDIGIETTFVAYDGLFCGKTTLNKGEYEGVLSKPTFYTIWMASRSFCVALCRKQVFFVKTTQGEDYSEFIKGIRERLVNSFNHGASTKSLPSKSTHSDHPLDLEEVI
jgi:hypothetical protein